MSARVISGRELLHNLRFEVAELRRGLAAAVERLEALEATEALGGDLHSRRVELVTDDRRLTLAGAEYVLRGDASRDGVDA